MAKTKNQKNDKPARKAGRDWGTALKELAAVAAGGAIGGLGQYVAVEAGVSEKGAAYGALAVGAVGYVATSGLVKKAAAGVVASGIAGRAIAYAKDRKDQQDTTTDTTDTNRSADLPADLERKALDQARSAANQGRPYEGMGSRPYQGTGRAAA